ncbi:MAG: hypothetical protein WCD18_14460, partial [Thermosynechococcaceae cyanobacterium]
MSRFLILDLGRYQCYNHKCRWEGLRVYSFDEKSSIKNETRNRSGFQEKEHYSISSPIISNEIKYADPHHSIADLY